jgi:hypothetical protein
MLGGVSRHLVANCQSLENRVCFGSFRKSDLTPLTLHALGSIGHEAYQDNHPRGDKNHAVSTPPFALRFQRLGAAH